ncbi:MAG: BlaI/MecI/CopY family transcriptional regulator [Candidatus Micrarchaeota archaeon]|nr:BlaI/MecI/CopY family transcriptional regulator [Candidatus Micrarchaeota archaeon]
MKSTNPFVLGLQTEELFGRKEEMELFSAYLDEHTPMKIAIVGVKGIGKTTLMKKFRQIADKNKLETKTLYAGRISISELKKEVADIIFIEDVDRNSEVLKKLEKLNINIIISSKSEKRINKNVFQIIKLRPLNHIEIKEYIEEKLKDKGVKIASGALETIIGESEGNPFVLLLVLWNIYDKLHENEKIITNGNYIAALPSTLELLGYKFFDELYFHCSEGEREILKVIVKSKNETCTPSDIASICKKPLNTVTTLIMRLVEKGNLVKISRGKYRVFNKLYVKYVSLQN